jgi:hypothetical protein
VNPWRYVPGPTDFLAGARDTNILLKVRWRMVRGTLPKAGVWAGAALLLLTR